VLEPRVPGTRAIYNVRDCLLVSVGFRGYFGGLPARCVISDSEFASTCAISAKPGSQLSKVRQERKTEGMGTVDEEI